MQDPEQVSARGIEGAPALVVEILSRGRAEYDRTVKAQRYAARGVPSYWIVDPEARHLECFRLEQGRYELRANGVGADTVDVPDFPGLRVPLGTIWFGRRVT